MQSREENIHRIRLNELSSVLKILDDVRIDGFTLTKDMKILEVGCGAGYWFKNLKGGGFNIFGLDLLHNTFHKDPVPGVRYYDGAIFPYSDSSFSLVLTSHVMEHVCDRDLFLSEVSRVLTPDGMLVVLVPNSCWRLWSWATHYISLPRKILNYFSRKASREHQCPDDNVNAKTAVRKFDGSLIFDALITPKHGAKGNRISELYFFSERYYKNLFSKNDKLSLTKIKKIHIFYTDNSCFPFLTIQFRRRLSFFLGSVSTCYVLRKTL